MLVRSSTVLALLVACLVVGAVVTGAGRWFGGARRTPTPDVPPTRRVSPVTDAVAGDLADLWPLRPGVVRRYRVQAEQFGPGVVEEQLVEETSFEGERAVRIRAIHRYDSGRSGMEELFVRREGRRMVVVARMTSAGTFGTYSPPMAVLGAPIVVATAWRGTSALAETDKAGVFSPPVPVAWDGAITAIEAVTVPAGRFPSCVKVRQRAGGVYETTEWFARGVGVVRREIRATTPDGVGPVLVLQELVASQ